MKKDIVVRFCYICGGPLQFDREAMTSSERAKFDRGDVKFEHGEGKCKNEVKVETHKYKVELQVFRDEEDVPLAKVAHVEEGISFEVVADLLGEALTGKWLQLLEWATTAEEDEA